MYYVFALLFSLVTFAENAVVKSVNGNEIYYAKSVSLDGASLIVIECSNNRSKILKRESFVVMYSDDLCLNVAFSEQVKFISSFIKELEKNNITEINQLDFVVPRMLSDDEEKILRSKAKDIQLKIKYTSKSFHLNAIFLNNKNKNKMNDIKNSLIHNRDVSSGDILNLIYVDKE